MRGRPHFEIGDVAGPRLFYREAGDPSNPPIVPPRRTR